MTKKKNDFLQFSQKMIFQQILMPKMDSLSHFHSRSRGPNIMSAKKERKKGKETKEIKRERRKKN